MLSAMTTVFGSAIALQARCEIGCLAHDSAFLCFARSYKVTDNNKPGGNANARLQRDRWI